MRLTRREVAAAVAVLAVSGKANLMEEAHALSGEGQAATRPGIQLPARFIPVPTSVSEEAQKVLAMASPYGDNPEPHPSDKEAWERRVQVGTEQMTQILAAMTAAYAPESLTEIKLSHCTLYDIVPPTIPAANKGKALFVVHGGAFNGGGGIAAAYAAYQLAKVSGLRTYSIDYRMPPKSPFPAGLDDCVEAYKLLIEQYGAANVAVFGPSAGGALIASTLLKARDLNLPMPACCVLHTPEADLTESGDSFETNLGLDPVLKRLTNSIALYADGHNLKDPYLSPLFGDFTNGFPPTLLSAGTRDLFLSNTVLMHRALKRAGIPAELSIWEAMGHAGFYGMAPEDGEMRQEHVDFILRHFAAG